MRVTPCNLSANTKRRWNVALAFLVPSPRSHSAVDAKGDGVIFTPCNLSANTKIGWNVALAEIVESPRSHSAVGQCRRSHHCEHHRKQRPEQLQTATIGMHSFHLSRTPAKGSDQPQTRLQRQLQLDSQPLAHMEHDQYDTKGRKVKDRNTKSLTVTPIRSP